MDTRPDPVAPASSRLSALRTTLYYAAGSAVWILFSDWLFQGWFGFPEQFALASALKGWLFTAVTALLLYQLLRRRGPGGAVAAAPGEPRPAVMSGGLKWSLLSAVLIVGALAAAGVDQSVKRLREAELLRLQSVAEFKSQQVAAWLRERSLDASFVATGADATTLLRQWRAQGDLRSRDRLLERLAQLQPLTRFDALTLLDERGQPLWSSRGAAAASDAGVDAALQAAARQRDTRQLGPYFDAYGQARGAIVVPLAGPDAVAGAPVPLLVGHLDVGNLLPPDLGQWPLSGASGEVSLVWRSAGTLMYLSLPEGAAGAARAPRWHVATPESLAARLLATDAPGMQLVDGVDFDGHPATAADRPVPGTQLHLLASMARQEITAAAWRDVPWIVLAGLLALFVAGALLVLARQREQLALSAREQQAQAEKLQALGLVAAIAEGSEDAIFAMDLEGRYTMFNAAAGRVVGKAPADVIGHDDRALFPPDQAQMLMDAGARALAEDRVFTQEEVLSTPQGERVFLATKGPLHDASGAQIGIFGLSRDITHLKQSERALAHANRALLASRECGQACMRASDEQELLRDVCRIVVQRGGYRMAWVGYAEDDPARTVRPVARWGDDGSYLDAARISWAEDDERGRGPTGRSIREQRPVFARSLQTETGFDPWRARALEHGFASSISIPLLMGPGRCLGAMTLYAAEADAFDEEEVRLLAELARDVAFGVRVLRDSAARLEAETLLRQQRERLLESQRIARVGSWEVGLPERTLAWSEETYRLQGLDPAGLEPTADDWPDLVDADDRAALRGWLARIVGGEPVEDLEVRVTVPGGQKRILSARGRLVRDEAGQPLRAAGTLQDVTALRLAHAALVESEASYRALTERVPAIIYRARLDADSSTTYISPAVESLGWTAEEWLDRPTLWMECLHEEDRDRVLEVMAGVQGGAGAFDVEYRLRTRDGQWRHIHDRAAIVRDAAGVPLALQGVMVDVSARVQAEAELRKLSQAVEQSPNSILITNVQAEIEYVNEAFLEITGYTREEVIGRNPSLLRGMATDHGGFDDMWASLTAGRPWRGSIRNRRKDGSEFTEFAHIAPLRQPDGRITHYVAVKEDISEKVLIARELDSHRRRLEELVQARTAELADARQRAEAANRAKSAFLANMSHEIRTPMNAIVGLSFLLQRDQVTPLQASRLEKIDAAALHLLSIINGILDLSKIEAGKMVLEEADFEPRAVLDRVRALISDRAQAKGVTVHVEPGALPTWLHGDATRLSQALFNYADNALKFTARGSIVLRASVLEEEAESLLLRFEVQDTGIGIADAELPRLFQTFEQADSSTTRRFGGTGLGLALTRRLAELMGGEAGVSSRLGVGSTFWLTVRARRVMASPVPAPGELELGDLEVRQRCGGARVLLAEDDAVNREVAIELLHAAGVVVDTAVDGSEALRLAQARPYDLVLMDMQMPVMDGFEATRRLRAEPRLAGLPIVALTANAFEDDRRACMAAGMNDFVSKPVDPKRLFATLLRWLPQRAPVDTPAAPAPGVAEARRLTDAERADILAALARVDGLNVERGLHVLGGDLRVYLEMLHSLARGHGDDAQRLRRHLAAGERDAALALAHRLRGAAGALGAQPLQVGAAALETALRQHEDDASVQALGATLCADCDAFFAALAGLPRPPQAGDPSLPDLAQLSAVLAELEPLIASDDTAAGGVFETHRALLLATLGPTAITLGQQLEAFDYPAALRTLRAALAVDASVAG